MGTTTDTDPAADTDAGEPTAPPATEPAAGAPDLAADVAKWKALARKHESDAKANREAAGKLAAIDDANKSELERALAAVQAAETRASEADQRVAGLARRAAVESAALKAGAIDADAIFALLPADAVTVDGDQVHGVSDAIAALQAAKPHLFGVAKPAPGSADGGRQAGP